MKWPTITLFPKPYDARASIQVTQLVFLIALAVAVAATAALDITAIVTTGALVALVLLVISTGIVMAPRVALTPSDALFYVVPVINVAAVVALRIEHPFATTGALLTLIVPAVWLGTSGRHITIALVGVLASLAVVPDLLFVTSSLVALESGTLSIIIMVPLAMMLAALFAFTLVDEAESASSAERVVRELRDAIVETVDAGILVLDGDGEVLLANRVVREHPVVSDFDRVDAASLQRIPAFQSDGVTAYPNGDGPIRRAMASDGNTEVLFWLHRADGTAHAFTASSTRLRDASGHISATVVALSDVTQFLSAVQVRDRLISTVSHELRTPLTAMKGFLELAREELPSDARAVHEHLAVVERNLDREHAIVEHFILAANSFDGRLQVRRTRLDLTNVVREVVGSSAFVAMRRDVMVRVVGGPVTCHADYALTSTVIDALLSNALSAIDAGGQVTLTVTESESGHARLTVADDGIGIADVDSRQLFDPFFRTERAHLEAVPGVGLGLPLVKQIVEAHDGSIEITSELGRGTSVVITLPVAGPRNS